MLANFLSGCAADSVATNSVDGGDDGEIEQPASTETFNVTVNTSTNYHVQISRNGDYSGGAFTSCVADEGEDILCIVDMYEMDMYMRGYTLNVGFSPDLCKYAGFYPYFFNNAPFGRAPTKVFYEEDADGVLIAPATDVPSDLATIIAAESVGDRPDIWYKMAGTWYSHKQLYNEQADSSEDLACLWDYAQIDTDYPNCCEGDYDLIVRSDGETNDSRPSWGGKIGNCFWGPGIKEYASQSGSLDYSGMPVYKIYSVDPTDGATDTFKTSAPQTMISEVGYGQVYAANYYKASEHSSNVPAATAVVGQSIYTAYQFLSNSSAHYQYDCYDQAMEVKARIRVVAREWNDYAEFLAFIGGDTSADPDTGNGVQETSPDQDSGDTSIAPDHSYVNDFADWKDLTENVTTGSMSFPTPGASYAAFITPETGFEAAVQALILGNHSDYYGFIIE